MSNQDIKKLYALSAGRCSLCNESLFQEDIHIGEMAHIIAKNPLGARGSISNTNDNRYENLILLCPNCHTKVDKDSNNYSIDYLTNKKLTHEQNIRLQTANNIKKKQQDVDALDILKEYWNFNDLLRIANTLPRFIHLDFFNTYEVFEEFEICFPQYRPFYDNNLEKCFVDFWNSYVGLINIFSEQIHNQKIPNTTQQVFTQADYYLNIHLSNDLPRDMYNEYCNKIENKKRCFFENYYKFLNYLRNY